MATIGSPAVNQLWAVGTDYHYAEYTIIVGLGNPATFASYVTQVSAFFNRAATQTTGYLLTLYHNAGDNYSIRDYASVTIFAEAGLKTWTGLSLEVQAGDFIGIALNNAEANLKVDAQVDGGGGLAKRTEDTPPFTDQLFESADPNDKLSLEGIYGLPTVFPSDAITRVTGLHHIYNPGMYRLGIQLGDVSNTIEIVERAARKKIEEIPKPKIPEPFPDVVPWPEPIPTPIPAPFPDVVPWPEEKPKEPSWWSTITPWKEEYGETFGKEVAERWRAITPWKEEKGETFGKEVSERWRAVTPWKEEKGETFVSAIKKIFKKPPKPPKPPDSYSPYFEGF